MTDDMKVGGEKSKKVFSNPDEDSETIPLLNQNKNVNVLDQKQPCFLIRLWRIFWKDFLICLIILSSIYLYVISLEGCHNTQSTCLVNLNPIFFHKIVLYLSLSSIGFSLVIGFTVKKFIKIFHSAYMSLIFAYLLLYYDTGSDLSHHGYYNRTMFIVLIILYTLVLISIYYLFKLIKLRYFKTTFSFFFLILLLFGFLSYRLTTSCEKWNKGFSNQEIVNDKELHGCSVVHPSSCWIEFMDGLLDVSWLLQETCENFRGGERKELMKYLPERLQKSNYLGYPITTNFSFYGDSHFHKFFNNVMTNVVDIENASNVSKRPEITLKFSNVTKLGTIEINIEKDRNLVQEREQNFNKIKINERPYFQNILFIYVDSISRQHFIRKLKRTGGFIEKFLNKTQTDFEAFQFMKYHAFIYFTQLNSNPMFYGESMMNSNGTHILKHFKEKGFITAQANNFCSRELYDIEDGYIHDITWESFDHENIAMFCDPNYYNEENPYTPYMGPYSIKRRCMYGKDTFQYVLDYGEAFWKTYLNEKKFLRIAFQDAHEGTGEVVSYLDQKLGEFLENFERNGYLKDTAIFFVSDHGNNMIGFYNIFNCEDFVLEKTLASLFILLPKLPDQKKEQIIKENMHTNEQIMVTPYDIYDTMLEMINLKKTSGYYSKYGASLLNSIDGKERDCQKYSLDLVDLWCRCKNY